MTFRHCLLAAALLARQGGIRAEETLLEKLEAECIRVVTRARPGVVQVIARRPGEANLPAELQEKGSGVVWNENGIIVTTFDAVAGARRAAVVDATGRRLDAEIVGRDPAAGIAILRVKVAEKEKPLAACPRGDSRKVRPGAFLFVVANAHDMPGSVSMGIAGGLDRTIRVGPFVQRGLLQTTAPINPGDSGGALVNSRGEMVGLVLASFNRAPSATGFRQFLNDRNPLQIHLPPEVPGGSEPPEGATRSYLLGPGQDFVYRVEAEASVGSEGIGFAIPVHRLALWVDEILASGRLRHSWFGLSLREASEAERVQLSLPAGRGLVVTEVVSGGPSAAAGLALHDILLAAGESPIGSLDDLYAVRDAHPPGTRVMLEVRRKGKGESIEVVLGEAPSGLRGVPEEEGGK